MHFLLSQEFTKKLHSLKEEYKKRAGVNLENSDQPLKISCFFGSKDIQTRKNQLFFIEQWLNALKKDLLSEDVPAVPTKKYLRALAILVAVAVYLQWQIEKTYKVRSANTAILVQLLNEALGISASNQLDSYTKAYCFDRAVHYLSKEGRFDEINADSKYPFTKSQWEDFLSFLTKENKTELQHNFPITEFITPIVAFPVRAVGESLGYLIGDVIGDSVKSLKSKYIFLATAGGSLMLGVKSISPQTTFVLLAPLYAERLLKALCGVSTAWVLGKAGDLVGKGAGVGIGLPLDLGWKVISKYGPLMFGHPNKNLSPADTNGISLLTKSYFIQGKEFSLVGVDSLINNIDSLTKEIELKQTPWEIEFNTQPNSQLANETPVKMI